MKTEIEEQRIKKVAAEVCELVNFVELDSMCTFDYEPMYEVLTFYVNGKPFIVNINMDSEKAALKDIASQFLSKNWYD